MSRGLRVRFEMVGDFHHDDFRKLLEVAGLTEPEIDRLMRMPAKDAEWDLLAIQKFPSVLALSLYLTNSFGRVQVQMTEEIEDDEPAQEAPDGPPTGVDPDEAEAEAHPT